MPDDGSHGTYECHCWMARDQSSYAAIEKKGERKSVPQSRLDKGGISAVNNAGKFMTFSSPASYDTKTVHFILVWL